MLLDRFTSTISLLQGQLVRERTEKAQITNKFIELDQQIRRELAQQKDQDNDAEERIIEELSIQLENKMTQNRAIKNKIAEQAAIIANFLEQEGTLKAAASLKRDN